MRLDSVTAQIRPRSDWEAADLGFALVRRDFWRCLTLWWLAMIVPAAIAGFLLWRHPLVLAVVFWWFKPAGSRLVLFQLSRRLFGEQPPWKSIWREIPRVWTRRFAYRFLWARFSPWLPVTMAVEDLEGLRGKSYKLRSGQLARRGGNAVMWIYFLADLTAAWVGLGIIGMVLMLIPEGQGTVWQEAVADWNPEDPAQIPLLLTWTVTACGMVAISLVDVFVTGAGFGVYINNRTWIEGWDVELAFKRLAQRLGKLAVVLLSFCVIGISNGAEPRRSPAEVIQEVKADPVFTVHSVTDRIPKPRPSRSSSLAWDGLAQMMGFFGWCAGALLLGFLGWVVWKCRHVFKLGPPRPADPRIAPPVRVVMGMDISPDTLPLDVPSAAWALWQQARHQEALGLLYRGSISRVMETAGVQIQESDTEGSCVNRVDSAGGAAHPDYFRGITSVWSRLAYAGIHPSDGEVKVLCEQWPFGKGGPP